MDDFPGYLVDVVAREAHQKDRGEPRDWDALDAAAKAGYMETARLILRARSVQSDIKR